MRGQKGRLSYLSSDAPMYLQTNALRAQCGGGACKIVSKELTRYLPPSREGSRGARGVERGRSTEGSRGVEGGVGADPCALAPGVSQLSVTSSVPADMPRLRRRVILSCADLADIMDFYRTNLICGSMLKSPSHRLFAMPYVNNKLAPLEGWFSGLGLSHRPHSRHSCNCSLFAQPVHSVSEPGRKSYELALIDVLFTCMERSYPQALM